jgi:hypothetical protein
MTDSPLMRDAPAGAAAADAQLLRIGAGAGITGVLAQVVLELVLHPSGAHPNDSVAAFREYAASTSWTAVHLGQFAAVLLVSIALVALAVTLRAEGGWPAGMAVVGALSVTVATAVFAVQMAVDGVALKHAISAWSQAVPGVARDSAFLVAESIRSTEKGLSALFHLTNAAALLALGVAVATSRRRRRWLGWIGAGAGVGFFIGAWSTAHTGFSTQAGAILAASGALAGAFVVGVSASMARRPRQS